MPSAESGIGRIVAMAVRFGAVGAFCAGLNLAIIAIGLHAFHLHYVAASLWPCVITIPVSYFLHRHLTFRLQRSGDIREFVRFVLTQLMQFALGLLLLAALVEWAGLPPLLGAVVMTGLMFVYGFLSSSTWVFRVFGRRSTSMSALEPTAPGRQILQVSAFFPAHGGGIEVVAGRLAQGLASAGCPVHWMAGGVRAERPEFTLPLLTIEQAGSIDMIEKRLGLPSPLWSFASLRRLWQAVGRCDLVHVHDFLYMPTLCAMLMAALRSKPVVLTQHIGAIPFESRTARAVLQILNRSLGNLVMRCASQVVFVGKPVLTYFDGFVSFRRPPRLIANGVDHALYRPLPGRAAPGLLLRCLFVGRFVEKKGLGLLRSCVTLPGVRWTFIGWGPMSPRTWGAVVDDIELHEGLRADELVPFFQAADLLVLPSTGEGFPLVIQEALACGTPVLVSTEVAEAFPATDPDCVFDVELRAPAAADALRDRLAALARQPQTLLAAREAAARLAQQWSWEACVEQYLQVYALVAPVPTAPQ